MIVTRLSGGIGNQMFQYAFGRALSLRNNVPLKLNVEAYLDTTERPLKKIFTIRTYNLEEFNIKAETATSKEIPFFHRMYGKGKIMLILDAIRRRVIPFKGKEQKYIYDNSKINLGPDTYVVGEWQSAKYFDEYGEIIRKEFSLKNPSVKAKELIKEIESKNSLCVHIRRGDYVGHSFHPVLNIQYYKDAINIINQKQKIDAIYVFDRDDIDWCKENIKFDYPVVFVENDISLAETLTVMSTCKNFVMANSSFSWWAVYLSQTVEKIVIAPKQWFQDSTIDTTDLIPPEWIRL